jgi:hypothetical protein
VCGTDVEILGEYGHGAHPPIGSPGACYPLKMTGPPLAGGLRNGPPVNAPFGALLAKELPAVPLGRSQS